MPKNTITDPNPNISLALRNLYYKSGKGWASLPSWALFSLQLGNQLSNFDIPDTRFTIVLSVPTRAFASEFIAAGVVCGRSCLPFVDDDLNYFEELWLLPPGTSVFYRDKKRKLKARKTENMDNQMGKFIGIQVDQGKTNTTLFITPDKARRIEISKREFLSLPGTQGGRQLPPPKLLIKEIFGEKGSYDFILQSKLDCVIIGPNNRIKQEINTIISPTEFPSDEDTGTLSDLLRVKEYQSQGQAYRSSVISGTSRKSIGAVRELSPYVVIFDGARSFNKWKDDWTKFNIIIVLERIDLNFDYTVGQINNEYYNRSNKKVKITFPPITPGIEMMFFIRDL